MKYIYLITSPSGKQYVGKSTIDPDQKSVLYQSATKYFPKIKRPILESIRKYGWDKMKFVIIERNDNWTSDELNEREKFWIQNYNTLTAGYNVTAGGDGHDSESAKIFWQNVSEDWKKKRAVNCSIGQKKRYAESTDSAQTRKRKSDAHKGTYQITSPTGKEWITTLGLKEFAEQYKEELNVTYWVLFGAYRKCYNNKVITITRKNANQWKVTRIDIPT
jgi:group I intron endonuclease